MITETSNDKKSVQEQANLWITRLDKGLSRAEKQQLIAWINQDESHYAALKKISFLWSDLATRHELSGLFSHKEKTKSQNDYLMKGLLASGLVCVALLTASLFSDVNKIWPNTQHYVNPAYAYQKYTSQYGEQKQVTLDDGSIVELNTNTIIEVAYSQLQRKITLIRGEAKFDVAKDKHRPFTVVSGHNSFTALGTVFNVQRDNISSAELLVKEGRVLIAKANAPVDKLLKAINTPTAPATAILNASLANQNHDNNIISAGEKVAIANDIASPTQSLSAQEVKQELAWQQGILIFDGEPLNQVLKEVQRYNTIKFMPVDSDLAQLRVSGYFKTNDLNALLQSLHYNFAIDAKEVTTNTYALSSNSNKNQ
jgi:transmembrane sensor